MKNRALLIGLVIFLLGCGQYVLAQSTVSDFQQLIESTQESSDGSMSLFSIEELLAETNIPGISVAVIKDFKIHWSKGYGLADVESGAAVDTETLFQAASISKTINAMAVLKAAEDGHFSIDDDINSILSSWQIADSQYTESRKVTPRSLASHVSGLGDGFGFPGYAPSAELPDIVQILNGDFPSNVGPVRMARPPMTAFHYSGGGVTVLQLALLDTFNRPYAEFLSEMVLTPIGMNSSTFEQPLPKDRDANAARAHVRGNLATTDKWRVYPELAAAGLWTTPTDLAKFAIEVQLSYVGDSNKVLNQQSTSEMLSPVGVGSYAVGFSVAKEGEGWYFSHGGSNFGFLARLKAHKVKGYGYVIMTNSGGGSRAINEVAKRIEQHYQFDTLAEPVRR